MGGSTLYYMFLNVGDFDYFQWVLHLSAWGQTQLFWLYDAFADSANSRMNYYLSFELTRVVPSIGQPTYTVWYTGYQSLQVQDTWEATKFAMKLTGWTIYYKVMRWY